MDKYKIVKINNTNLQDMEFAYLDFLISARRDYGFEITPLEFEDFKELTKLGAINTFALYEKNILKSFLIYNIILDTAEITIIHTFAKDTNQIEKKKALIKTLMDEESIKNCKIISYAMMGKQADFVKEIAMFGFEFVGQAIVNFDLTKDSISRRIFDKVSHQFQLPESFKVVNWDDKYAKNIVDLIYLSFYEMQDKKFDSRFASKEGCEDILAKITENIYGNFLPQYTKILLQDGIPVGFCLINLTTDIIANVPLIGISPSIKFKKLGQTLLSLALKDIITATDKGLLPLLEINATVDTDNLPAINIYRKTGFKESVYYPQAYCEIY